MLLDMLHVHRLGNLGHLVDPTGPLQNVRVILLDPLDVTLEVSVIHGVETHNGRPETQIGLCQRVTDEVVGFRKDLLDPVERFEEWVDIVIVRGLSGRETGLVDAVVDGVVDPFIDSVDLGLKGWGVVVDASLGGNQLVKRSVQHPDNLTALVVD